MNKKGFTLIEIIICVALISVIGTVSTIFIIKNKNTDFESITKEILESAKVFATIEKDEEGNTYMNGVYNGRRGVSIPLKTLVNEGYIEENLVNKVYEKTKTKKEEDQFILLLSTTESPSKRTNCADNQIILKASWTIKEDKPIYLCGSREVNKDNVTSIINNINVINASSKNVKYNLEKIPVSEPEYEELSKTLSSDDLKKYTTKENGWFIYYNEQTDRAYSFFRGTVNNNYLELGNIGEQKLIWRVVWIRDDGQMKIVLDDTVPIELKDKSGNVVVLDNYKPSENNKMIYSTSDKKYYYISITKDTESDDYNGFHCKDLYNLGAKHQEVCMIINKEKELEPNYNGKNIFTDNDIASADGYLNFINNYLNYVWKYKTTGIFDKDYITNNNFCYNKFTTQYSLPETQFYFTKNNNFECSEIRLRNESDSTFVNYLDEYLPLTVGELKTGELNFAGAIAKDNYLDSDTSYHVADYHTSTQGYANHFYYNGTEKSLKLNYLMSYYVSGSTTPNNVYIDGSTHVTTFQAFTPINLKPAVILDTNKITFSGNGTKDNPYIIQEK